MWRCVWKDGKIAKTIHGSAVMAETGIFGAGVKGVLSGKLREIGFGKKRRRLVFVVYVPAINGSQGRSQEQKCSFWQAIQVLALFQEFLQLIIVIWVSPSPPH